MERKKTYKLSERELRGIIKEAIKSVVTENTMNEFVPPGAGGMVMTQQLGKQIATDLKNGNGIAGISFGIQKRKLNNQKIAGFVSQFESLATQVMAIRDELERRIQIIQSASNGGVNEGKAGILRTGRKLLGTTSKVTRKVAPKVIGAAAGVTIGAACLGIPQKITDDIRRYRNPKDVTAVDVEESYGMLAQWIQQMCLAVQESPQILGAYAISKDLANGPQDPTKQPIMTGSEAFWLAASIGASFMGPVGWVYDALDLVGAWTSAKANDDEETLRIVEKQREYLLTAIKTLNNVLQGAKTKSLAPTNNTQIRK